MEKEKFYKMLNNKEYEELERELKNEYSENRNLETKYQLGICYGEQFNKIENAKKVFKELMNTDFNPPYIYSFNAKHTRGNIEKLKILNEGLRNYPDSRMLNNQLLFYLENNEKEQQYKELDKKDILIYSVMGLCGESGEAIDIVKKWLAQGHELDKDHLAKELGNYIKMLEHS